MNAKLIASLILAGLAAIFIFQNEAMVELKFLDMLVLDRCLPIS